MKKGFSKEYVKASALEKVSCIATPGEGHFSVIQLPIVSLTNECDF